LETLCQGQKNSETNFCFLRKKSCFFSIEGRKNSFSKGNKCSSQSFFCPRHNAFQPKGYIFLGFHPLTYHKPLHFNGFCFILSLQILHNLLDDRLGGVAKARIRLLKYLKKRQLQGPNVTTLKISKKISHAFMLCWNLLFFEICCLWKKLLKLVVFNLLFFLFLFWLLLSIVF